jgi:branched-chain amino acid aminotransferase
VSQPVQQNPKYIWWSGRLLPWEEATVHVTAVGWPAVSAVFEGVRAYWNQERETLYVFRLDEHLQRLQRSMRFMHLGARWSAAELTAATAELLRANGYREDVYLQPMAFALGGNRGNQAMADQEAEVYVTTRPSPSKLGAAAPLKACVSSWTRIHEGVLPPRVKAVVNYQNSRLGSTEAARGGYDAAIFLNPEGKVAEGGGSCLFLVRAGRVVTPSLTSGILESITRASLLELCRAELGLAVEERTVDRTELYFADEVFFCGTAQEIAPVGSVDGYAVGDGRPGPVTRALSALYERVVRGREAKYAGWLHAVQVGRGEAVAR